MMKASLLAILVIVLLLVIGGVRIEAQQPKKVFRIGYLSSGSPASEAIRSAGIRRALHELGYIEGQSIAVESRYGEGKPDRYPELATELVRLKVDVIVVSGGTPLARVANYKSTVDLALKGRLPSMFWSRQAVEAGGLMSYGADLAESYRQSAWYIDKILKGSKPADLPVQQPMGFEFVINLQTAKQIGLKIPQSVLMRADRVIK